jgi:hypothetical protein
VGKSADDRLPPPTGTLDSMGLRSSSIFLVAIALAACTPSARAPETTEAPAPTESRLVVVDTDGSVVTIRPDGSEPVQIAVGGGGRLFFQPQWSPQADRVAWGESTGEGFAVAVAGADGSEPSTYPTFGLPFYLAWSPDGSRLVALYNNAQSRVEARVIDVGAGEATVLGSARPYYFSWSPDSTRIVANRNGQTLDVIEVGGRVTTIDEGSLTYLAPAWTEAGIFHLVPNGLALGDDSGRSTVLAGIPHAAWFAPNRDGSKLAVLALGGEDDGPRELTVALDPAPDLAANSLSVIDVTTGEIDIVTSERTAGFFWSPDGGALAVLVAGQAPGQLQWVVWRDGSSSRLTSFQPPQSFVLSVLQFAPQYSLSLHLWSPASDALAFPGDIRGRSGIWVQSVDGSDPVRVSGGDWVAWSSR